MFVISSSCTGAAIDVERGRENLGKAEEFKKKALKKKFICIVLLVVASLIILLGESILSSSLHIKGFSSASNPI